MRTVYIDSEYHCHVENDGTMTAVQDAFFDGKCDAFIDGFCYEPRGEGAAVYPFRPFEELDAAQRAYEKEQRADAENALAILLGGDTV